MKKVSILMGSKNDYTQVESAVKILKEFSVTYDVKVMSAHRTPKQVQEYVESADQRGTQVFIAAAGCAAHLAGVVAAHTVLPVIGLPIESASLKGMDSLLSTVQMPGGIPVATVSIGSMGAKNAGLLAVQMLSLSDSSLYEKLLQYRKDMIKKVIEDDKKLQEQIYK